MTFGQRLKNLRVEADLTQSELGDKLKLSKSNISKYESNDVEPNIQTINGISELFNVSTDYLLGKSESKNSNKEIPDDFSSPEAAIKFILEQNVIMGFGGFDVNKMSDEEVVEFANELLNQLRLISYKYKK